MDHETEQEEIKPLIFNYIFHVILYVLIFVMHLIMYQRVYWIYDSTSILFLLGSFINILYIIFPVYPLIIIFLKKYKIKIINSVKKFTLILLIITITFGLVVSIVLLINSLNSKIFCKECPFNLNLSHLNAVFKDYYSKTPDENEIKNECNSRRCILDREESDEEYPYYYLCNYDPSEEFDEKEYKRLLQNGTEISTEKQIKCRSVTAQYELLNLNKLELHHYLELCYYLADFYYCQRFNKPEKYYNLDLELSCPETNYLLLIIILCVLIIIIDIIIALLPWLVEYMSLKRIIIILSQNSRKANSVNSTAKSSHISEGENSFKKEKTPVLIIYSDNEININNQNKDDLLLQIKQSTLKESKINLQNSEAEAEKNIIKPINIKTIQNSERNKLNRDLLFEIDSIKMEDKDKEFPNRNKMNIKHEESTTLYSHRINQLNIKIDNQNA